MNNEKVLNLIGLAMRARKLVLGQDFVLSALKASPQSIIFLASDAGDNIVKKINNKAKTFNATLVHSFTSTELSKAVGKENRRVILVTDKGFIKKFNEYLNS